MIQITSLQLVIFLGALGICQYLIMKWFESRLTSSIQHEYSKKLEDYKFSQLQRQKAELLARLFAHWGKYRGLEEKVLTKTQLYDYFAELNQLSFEIALWIKDEDLLNKIMDLTQLKPDSPNVRQLIGEARKILLDLPKDKFDSNNITLWPNDDISSRLFKK